MNAYNQIQNPYPPLKDVPDELINLAGPCGPISVWLVLQRHGIYVPPNEIINSGEGHFSPLAGSKANKLLLPYSIEGEMLKSEFNKRWRSNGILRQSIIVS